MSQIDTYIVPGTEDSTVAGLLGRMRLQKHSISQQNTLPRPPLDFVPPTTSSPTASKDEFISRSYKKNWMEIERCHLQAYEYLCHMSEAKQWVEQCIGETIGPLESLGFSLQNGVYLAQLATLFQPKVVKRIFKGDKLQFRHSDNIHFFLEAAQKMGLPKTFMFELTDLYSRKNIPKVIYCLHALSHLLSKQGLAPDIQDLVGYLDFTDDQLITTKEELDLTGCKFPAFLNVGSDLNRAMEGTASIKILGRPSLRTTSSPLPIENNASTLIKRHAKSRSVRGKTITLVPSHIATLNTAPRSTKPTIAEIKFTSNVSLDQNSTWKYPYKMSLLAQNSTHESSLYEMNSIKIPSLQNFNPSSLTIPSQPSSQDKFHPISIKSSHSSRHIKLSHITYIAPTQNQMESSPKLAMACYKEMKKRPSRRYIESKKLTMTSMTSMSMSKRSSSTRDMGIQATLKLPSPINKNSILRLMPSFDPPTTNSQPPSSPYHIPSSLSSASSNSSQKWNKIKIPSLDRISGLFMSPTSSTHSDPPHLPEPSLGSFGLTPLSEDVFQKQSPQNTSQIMTTVEPTPEISTEASPLMSSEGDSETGSYSPITAEESGLVSPYQETLSESSPGPTFQDHYYKEEPLFQPNSEIYSESQAEYSDEDEFEWEHYEAFIIMAQSYVRGIQQRQRYRLLKGRLMTMMPVVIELQALTRGYLTRINTIDPIYELRAVKEQIDLRAVRRVQAEARRVLARHRFIPRALEARAQAEGFFDHLYKTQALARRVLVQRKWTYCLEALQNCRDVITTVQAKSRGFLVRQHYLEKFSQVDDLVSPPLLTTAPVHQHYEKIVKFQEHYWAHRYAEPKLVPQPSGATIGIDPPITAMKNFLHLLDDSDKDFSEELQLEEGRQRAVKKIREIAQTEKALNTLDIKIALLVRNRISFEEVIKLTRVGGPGSFEQDRQVSKQIPLKNLDKENRQRLEGYQQLFYLLQTQPQYLARLLSLMNQPGNAGRMIGSGMDGSAPESKRFFETVVLTLFGFANAPREEYMLLRLFRTAIHQELESINRIEEFLRGNPVFIKLAVHYNRGAKERKYLRELLQPIIHTILDDPNIDLQSNPLLIYRALIKQEESRTGERSMRPYDVTAEVAIQDAETRSVLIHHLQKLRSITDQFIESIYSSLENMPYGIRYIAKELKASLLRKFPTEREEVIVRIVGHLVYYRYINPAIVAPESFGVIEMDISPHHRRCLAEVAKMLNQVSMGKLFSDDNVFLQPLNKYVHFTSEKFASYVNSVTEVDEPEAYFGTDALLDLTALGRRPVIYISPSEIYSMHALLADRRELVAPDPEDPLATLLDELGPPPTVPSDQITAHNREISLHLVNRFPTINERDCELKQLFVEAKRLITYVIRVQSGTSLLDILEKSSGPVEEERFDSIINKELLSPQNTKESLQQRTCSFDHDMDYQQKLVPPKLVDISNMSFHQLKQLALEYAMLLENGGWVDKEDGYQKLLNSIAADIRTKTKRRMQRTDELTRIKQTLANLNDKAMYLEDQRRTYADYLESCILRQASTKKKKSLIPFTKQYFHMKELERRGEMPQFGSFRYTAEKLYQKGVLVSINDYGLKQFDKILITFSSHQLGQFDVLASYLGTPMPGGDASITLEELLQYQFDNIRVIALFNGDVRVNVNLLVYLINKKFYT